MKHTKTLKVRVKDKHAKRLLNMAASVNYVWNYCNQLSSRAIKERSQFLSGYTLQAYTKGANKELGLHSQTPQMVGAEYAARRKQFKKAKLKWRKTYGAGRSLGWVPLNGQSIKWKNGQVVHNGQHYKVIDSYGLSRYKFRSASFVEDARGRWYFCVAVSVEAKQSKGRGSAGIDLGCRTTATTSDGDKLKGRHYRSLELKLGNAQRANKKKHAKTIHAKIKNQRADGQHKFTRKLVNENAAIFVGNVSSKKLIKTKMAKSVLDAGWYNLKTMLKYKCQQAGVVFEEVNESYTTQACSCCGCISSNSPKGRAGLEIREWTCAECGTEHDRDINAAKNILALGHGRLVEGIPRL